MKITEIPSVLSCDTAYVLLDTRQTTAFCLHILMATFPDTKLLETSATRAAAHTLMTDCFAGELFEPTRPP